MLVMGRKKERKPIVKPYIADREAIALARSRANLTLHQLEAKAGISYTTISRITSGDIDSPQWPTLEKMAKVFELDVNNLVLWRDRDLEAQARHNKEIVHYRFDSETNKRPLRDSGVNVANTKIPDDATISEEAENALAEQKDQIQADIERQRRERENGGASKQPKGGGD